MSAISSLCSSSSLALFLAALDLAADLVALDAAVLERLEVDGDIDDFRVEVV